MTLLFRKSDSGDRRSFSISSASDLGEPLTITVKRIDNGEYSRHLFDVAKVGDNLISIGTSGYFTLPEDLTRYQQFFFLAAGSGITPILPLMKVVLTGYPSIQVILMYSNRTPGEAIFLEELENLRRKFSSQLQVEYLFSSSQNLLKARLTKSLLREYVETRVTRKEQTFFFICGPSSYMQMATITLLTEGIPADNIRKENFSTEKPVIKELPPDTNPHGVQISFEGKRYDITVQYPLTILETAKRAGIILPYSCEAGKCGTCSATCLQGKVWLSYNEVLTDRELNKGRILTCTGYPYGDEDVKIVFPDL